MDNFREICNLLEAFRGTPLPHPLFSILHGDKYYCGGYELEFTTDFNTIGLGHSTHIAELLVGYAGEIVKFVTENI